MKKTNKTIIAIFIALAAFIFLGFFSAIISYTISGYGMPMMNLFYGGNFFPPMIFFIMLIWILIIILLVLAIIWLSKNIQKEGRK